MTGVCRRRTHQRCIVAASASLAFVALLIAAAVAPARAADWLDDTPLRGSLFSSLFGAPVGWDGLYIGGTMGVANSDSDYSDSTHDFVAYSLRETALGSQNAPQDWAVLGSDTARGQSYGGFIGYNVTWEQVVLSGEIAYNKVSGLDSSATGSIYRTVTNSNGTDNVYISATNSLKLNDYGTVRARIGYAFGQFLPYGFVGAAIGRFDYTSNIYLSISGADNGTFTQDDSQSGAIVGGFTAGLGADVALAPNVFLRGEWEFMAFGEYKGIRVSTNTARAGLAIRF